MIRATELAGRAVVDIDAAEKVGTIDKIVLDPDGRRVAGFVVTRTGSSFPGTRTHALIPATAVHAVGPDAVTIRQSAVAGTDIERLENLPKGSDVTGRKVVSEDGRFLGKISDVLIENHDGRIIGYLLAEHTPGKLTGGAEKKRRNSPYLPSDAKIRAGRDLIVASEDAVSYDWEEDGELPRGPATGTPMSKWGYTAPASPTEPHTDSWVRAEEDHIRPMVQGTGSGLDGIETARETNPRVR
jgi:uncharacterized protein YrrD